MKISILDDYHDTLRGLSCFQKLAGHEVEIWNDHTDDLDTLAQRLKDTEALVLIRERTRIRAPILASPQIETDQPAQRIPAHRYRRLHAARHHRVLKPARRHSVLCNRGADLGPDPFRNAPNSAADGRVEGGKWQVGVGNILREKTLGIFGYGRIGQVVAGYGVSFGMNVTVWSSEDSRAQARSHGHAAAASKEAFFEECDVISLHLRLVDRTRGIVTASDLAHMKPTALIVNTSRAQLIEPGALVHALKAGRPGLAAVDVYEEEPVLDTHHPLLGIENSIFTPHIGYVTQEEYEVQFSDIFDQIVAYGSGQPINIVNPAALKFAC